MTVISYRNNHFNTSRVATRSINISKESEKFSLIQWFNIGIFCIIMIAISMNVLLSVGENSFRLDIQNKEKEIMQLEENNAELKTRLSKINTPVNLEKVAADYGLVKVSQPRYFTIKENIIPLSFNATNNQEN